MGVCIRKGEEGLIKADRFVYDLGKKNPGTGLEFPVLATHFDQVKGEHHPRTKSFS